MNNFYKSLNLVAWYNSVLFFRNASGKKAVRIHSVLVIILTILPYSAFTWLFLSELGNEELSYLLAVIMFVLGAIYIFLEVLTLTTRYTDYGRGIIPRNLLLLPLSSSQLYLMIMWDMFFNVNTLCFLASSAIILIRVPTAGIAARMIPFIIPVFYAVLVSIWITNLYVLSAKWFTRNKQLVVMIPYMVLVLMQVSLQMTTGKELFRSIVGSPVVGQVLSGILFSITRDWMRAIYSVAFLLLFSGTGLVVGRILVRRFRHNFSG